MTDRHAAYIVTLDHDVRADDAEGIVNALRMVRGVAGVDPVPVDAGQHIARVRVRLELCDRVYRAIDEAFGEG